ncbi:MAG: hypothetical protein ACOY32_05165 [Thermodesulfobacteriota bacterium]
MKKKMLLATIPVILFSAIVFCSATDAGARGSSGGTWSGGSSSGSWSDGGMGGGMGDNDEVDCLACHADLVRFPRLQYENPDKHHLFVGQPIPAASIVPYDTGNSTYECLSCHAIEPADDGNAYLVTVERNCLNCHPASTVTGSPRSNNLHHRLPNYRCSDCHRGGH